jgi:hypothetical protein
MANKDGDFGDFTFTPLQQSIELRDYFAGQALPAVIAKVPLLKFADPRELCPDAPRVSAAIGDEVAQAVAELAYRYADFMLAARLVIKEP